MAETVKNIILKARALLDQYSDDGVVIPDDELLDFQAKSIPVVDMGHKEIYEQSQSDLTKEEPNTLAEFDDETEVNYKADQAIVYYLAARLAPYKNKELVIFFESKYEDLKRKAVNKATEVAVEDVYAGTEESEEV